MALPIAIAALALQGLSSGSSMSAPRRGASTPPNVLVIVADDLGTDLLRAYEGFYPGTPTVPPPPPTPAIDWLAAGGVVFTDCWTAPVCTPTRAQILTGRASQRTGLGGLSGEDDPEPGLQHSEQTLPQLLRRGHPPYATAAVGKWHLASTNGQSDWSHPLGPAADPWFDIWAGSLANLGAGRGTDYNSWEKTFATPVDPLLDEVRAPRRFPGRVLLDEHSSSAPSPAEYATVDTIDDAVHLVGTLPEPWFLYVAFNAPHVTTTAPALPLAVTSCAGFTTDPTCAFAGSDRPEQVRCMSQWMDNELGRLLCDVDAEGLGERTVLFFIGDNGTVGDRINQGGVTIPGAIVAPFDKNHGKGTVFQGGVNVPLIVRGPGIVPRVRHDLVSSTDLLATILDIAGAREPDGRAEDSVSFAPILYGADGVRREHVFVERFNPNFAPVDGGPPAGYEPNLHARAIRDARFKLIRSETRQGDGSVAITEHLFDLRRGSDGQQVDPFEQNDLRDQVTPGGSSPLDRAYRRLLTTMQSGYPSVFPGNEPGTE